jgi:hypothetical protein
LDYCARDEGNGMPNTPEADVHQTDCPPLAEIELVDLFGMESLVWSIIFLIWYQQVDSEWHCGPGHLTYIQMKH